MAQEIAVQSVTVRVHPTRVNLNHFTRDQRRKLEQHLADPVLLIFRPGTHRRRLRLLGAQRGLIVRSSLLLDVELPLMLDDV